MNERYKEVFEPDLGCLKDFQVSLSIKLDAVPVYKRAHTVPFQKCPLIEAELEQLEQSGVIKPVAYSEWASPIVAIVKSEGRSVRICADFKETLNPICNISKATVWSTLCCGNFPKDNGKCFERDTSLCCIP